MASLRRAAQQLLLARAGARGARGAGSLPKPLDQSEPVITEGRQAFEGDLRSTSGLGLGDGLTSHTDKWLQQVCVSRAQGTSSPMACKLVSLSAWSRSLREGRPQRPRAGAIGGRQAARLRAGRPLAPAHRHAP